MRWSAAVCKQCQGRGPSAEEISSTTRTAARQTPLLRIPAHRHRRVCRLHQRRLQRTQTVLSMLRRRARPEQGHISSITIPHQLPGHRLDQAARLVTDSVSGRHQRLGEPCILPRR